MRSGKDTFESRHEWRKDTAVWTGGLSFFQMLSHNATGWVINEEVSADSFRCIISVSELAFSPRPHRANGSQPHSPHSMVSGRLCSEFLQGHFCSSARAAASEREQTLSSRPLCSVKLLDPAPALGVNRKVLC
jgi:hypothetical protein